jgi:hypothetical protein
LLPHPRLGNFQEDAFAMVDISDGDRSFNIN